MCNRAHGAVALYHVGIVTLRCVANLLIGIRQVEASSPHWVRLVASCGLAADVDVEDAAEPPASVVGCDTDDDHAFPKEQGGSERI